MLDVTVAVCTRNPRPDYLSRTLRALRAQTLHVRRWELLLVDNASDGVLSERWDLSWHPRGRHVREDELGLTQARFRAIAEAQGDLIVFVDDDNLLAPNYIEQAVRIAQAFPHLGVFGSGAIEPEFETAPPPALRPQLPLLVIRKVPAPRWSNQAGDYATIPWGAGLVVVRSVADSYKPFAEQLDVTLLGRRGDALFSGEDELFSSIAAAGGLGFGIFPQLQLTHLIGAHRLNRRHMRRLIHDHSFSSGLRHYLVRGIPPTEIDAFACARLALHGLRRGVYSMRSMWAEMIGEHRAARLIAARQLKPLEGAAHLASPLQFERRARR